MASPRSAPLRVALVGAGVMGSHHARVVSQCPATELTLVVEPDREKGTALAERFGSRWVGATDDLTAYDAVVVAAPTEMHAHWASSTLAAGVPTLVEKPLSEDLAEVEALLKQARDRGTVLMCGLLERFNPAIMTMMDIARAPIHAVAMRHSPYEPRIRTGVAFDLLVHDVDLVVRLASSTVSTLSAHFGRAHPDSRHGAEDVAELNLGFDCGMVASLSASRVSQRKIRSFQVAEIDQLVDVDLLRQDVTVYRHVGAELIETERIGYRQQTIVDIPVIPYRHEPLAAQWDHFVGLVRGEGDPVAEIDSILEPHRLVAAAVDAAQHNAV